MDSLGSSISMVKLLIRNSFKELKSQHYQTDIVELLIKAFNPSAISCLSHVALDKTLTK